MTDRRAFLKFLASSPLFASIPSIGEALAQTRGHLQILSTVTSSAVEDVIEARGGPIWYQLYTTNSFDVTTKLVKRAEAAGCPAVAVTVDLPAGRNTETATRLARVDTRNC